MRPPEPRTDPHPVLSSLRPPGLSPAVVQARKTAVRSPSKRRVTDRPTSEPRAPVTDDGPLVSPRFAPIDIVPDSLGKHAKLHSRLFLSGGLDTTVQATRPRGDVLPQHSKKQHTALVPLSSCAKNGVPVVTPTAP